MANRLRAPGLAAVIVTMAVAASAHSTSPAASIPDECPRVMLVWSPGYPAPEATELRPGVVVALWDSGAVLRAETLDRPSGPLTVGDGRLEAVSALIEEVKDSVADITPELEAIRRRIYALPVSQVRRIQGRVDPPRWRCPPIARW